MGIFIAAIAVMGLISAKVLYVADPILQIRIRAPQSEPDVAHSYFRELLALALEKTADEYGPASHNRPAHSCRKLPCQFRSLAMCPTIRTKPKARPFKRTAPRAPICSPEIKYHRRCPVSTTCRIAHTPIRS